MDRITVRGKGGKTYLTGFADACWGGRPVGERAFCAGCHGAKDNRGVDRSKCGPLALVDRLAAYEDAMPLERAKELAQAEKDGRLVVLPFCVKTLLYEATEKGAREYEVDQFSIGVEELLIHAIDKCIWYRGGRIFGQEQIGKTVFLTHEEAEAALKKREES